MKSTGIVRRIDELGRIVIPIEIRRNLELAERDSVEFLTEGDRIVLRKYQDACLFCNSSEKIIRACLKNSQQLYHFNKIAIAPM